MRLFKFVGSKSAVLNMAEGLLKFTPLGELNDPTELTPVMDHAAVRSSLELLRIHGYTQDQYDWLVRQDAVMDLLAPQEKRLNVPKSREEATRILSNRLFDGYTKLKKCIV
jgi:hypothetical protein